MKKLSLLVAFVALFASVMAQAPQKFNYQAVVRNTDGTVVANTNVSLKVSLLQGSVSGSAVFVETHNPLTNAGGLFTVSIGDGTAMSGSLAAIDWANGPFFLRSEVDPAGGTNYAIVNTQQMMSVPYALYAETSGNNGVSQGYVDSAIANISLTGGATVVYDGTRNYTGCDTVMYGGYPFTESEQFFDLALEAGVLHFYNANIVVNHSVLLDTTVLTPDSSYTWHGTTYTTDGTYEWHGTSTEGCSIDETMHLLLGVTTSATVTFGDTSWSPILSQATYYPSVNATYIEFINSFTSDGDINFPYTFGIIDGMSIGTHTLYNEDMTSMQYYEESAWYLGSTGQTIGDWLYYSGNATITSFDTAAGTISGSFNVVLWSVDDYVNNIEDMDLCLHRNLTINFIDVPLVNAEAPVPPDTNNGVSITFGDTTWTPDDDATGYSNAVYYPDYNVLIVAFADSSYDNYVSFPYVVGYIDTLSVGPHGFYNDILEYYEHTWYQSSGNTYGDWQYLSGNATITAHDATAQTVSGSINAVMYSLTDIVEDSTLNENTATHRNLTVTFNNLSYTTHSNAAASIHPTSHIPSLNNRAFSLEPSSPTDIIAPLRAKRSALTSNVKKFQTVGNNNVIRKDSSAFQR